MQKVLNINPNKATRKDGHSPALYKMLRKICPGLNLHLAGLSIMTGHIRHKWFHDVAVAVPKPGKTDNNMGHLGRINLITTLGRMVEAVIGDITEREMAHHPNQGGYTSGVSVVGGTFLIYTAKFSAAEHTSDVLA